MDTREAPALPTPGLGRHTIDTDRSTLAFRTRHVFGLLPVRGTFAIRSGTVDVSEPLGDSAVRAVVDAASFRTGNGGRDRVVRSARFLDTVRHPDMTFASVRVDAAVVAGTLTVRGIERPVDLVIEEAAVTPGGFTVRARARVDRTAFGVTASRGLTGRHLDITLEVTCVRG